MKLITTVVLFAFGLSACTSTPAAQHSEGRSLAFWPDHGDLAALTQGSDLVVEAIVVRRLDVREAKGHPAQRVPVSYTESLVRVTRALKGPGSGELRVVQVGKVTATGDTYPEFPVLQPGSAVVLFLVDVSNEAVHADGTTKYAVIGPVGLFTIRNGRLTSAASGRGHASVEEATRLELGTFRARVKDAAE